MSNPSALPAHPDALTIHAREAKFSQMARLYDEYERLVYDFANAMKELDKRYLELAGPVGIKLAERVVQNRCVITDDFIEALHGRSRHLADQAEQLKEDFYRQRIWACNLARLD